MTSCEKVRGTLRMPIFMAALLEPSSCWMELVMLLVVRVVMLMLPLVVFVISVLAGIVNEALLFLRVTTVLVVALEVLALVPSLREKAPRL